MLRRTASAIASATCAALGLPVPHFSAWECAEVLVLACGQPPGPARRSLPFGPTATRISSPEASGSDQLPVHTGAVHAVSPSTSPFSGDAVVTRRKKYRGMSSPLSTMLSSGKLQLFGMKLQTVSL